MKKLSLRAMKFGDEMSNSLFNDGGEPVLL